MAETVKGVGIVWGVNGVTFTAGIDGANNASYLQSLNLDRTSDTAEIKNGDGETVGKVFYNGRRVVSVTAVPSGATLAAAVTSLDGHLIAPGTKVTLADTDGTTIDANYNCLSSKMRKTNTDATVADVELEKFDNSDITNTIT